MKKLTEAIHRLARWEADHRYLDREVRSLEREISEKHKNRRAAQAGIDRARATIKRLGGAES